MADALTLTLRVPLDGPLDLGQSIAPDRLATLTEDEIARSAVWYGARAAQLGELFQVQGHGASHVRVLGATPHLDGLGGGMTAGTLSIEGDVGRRAGAGMSGGVLTIDGSAGADAGTGMMGGTLRIAGDAGDRLGAAHAGAARGMTGGEILVLGSAGDDVGARARRGLIVVAGDVGARAARAMIAGSLVVLGRAGASTGVGSKRGTVIAVGGADVPATYQYACVYAPPHVRLTMTYLQRRHALAIAPHVVAGRYNRYCGDAGDPGRGEILVLESA